MGLSRQINDGDLEYSIIKILPMKLFHVLLFLSIFSVDAFTQIYGNGKQKTKTSVLKNLKSIDIQFNANIILDYDLKEEMIITADENVMDFIGQTFEDGKLSLDQIKWIEPSKLPSITIGTPVLEYIYHGTHSKTTVRNVSTSNLKIAGNVGEISVSGKTKNLSAFSTGTNMDLSNLEIDNAFVSIDDDSKVILDKVKQLKTDLDEDARLVLLSEIKDRSDAKELKENNYAEPNPNLKWIEFKIKNNSAFRTHFVVEGPKKDGSKFSYGFSLFPSRSKKEKWSVGTKVYRETRSGGRELLVTISSDDEGKLVHLFK